MGEGAASSGVGQTPLLPRSAYRWSWADTPPSVDRMTDRCKNITLPRTSFASGINTFVQFKRACSKIYTCTLFSGLLPKPITHEDYPAKFRATCIDTAAELPKDVKDRMPTILCVHGSGGSHEDFVPLLNDLVEDHGFRAVCLNWPGINIDNKY